MKSLSIIGIDLAKNIFQVHGSDSRGRRLFSKRVRRDKLVGFVSELPRCVLAMEACGGAHYWSRVFIRLGFEVRMIAPQFVKPFVKSNKNDSNDAEAICEASQRQSMRFVPVKSIQQQDIQSLHRIRQMRVAHRVALVNEARGLFAEYGVVMSLGVKGFREGLKRIIEESEIGDVTMRMKIEAQRALSRFVTLQEEILQYDRDLKEIADSDESSRRIQQIRGVGPLTATAVLASIGNASNFKNGREFAAWAGLVPKQSSSGGKTKLLGISKRGDRYLRTLLIHGARASLITSVKREDRTSLWARALVERRGLNKASVALANKNARVIWALLAKKQDYLARVA